MTGQACFEHAELSDVLRRMHAYRAPAFGRVAWIDLRGCLRQQRPVVRRQRLRVGRDAGLGVNDSTSSRAVTVPPNLG